jgi:hypothetical protein
MIDRVRLSRNEFINPNIKLRSMEYDLRLWINKLKEQEPEEDGKQYWMMTNIERAADLSLMTSEF